jgi:hypothetical protein
MGSQSSCSTNSRYDLGSSRHAMVQTPPSEVPKPRARAVIAPPTEELKMVLLVNQELKMGKGKIAAQCCHAAVGVLSAFSAKRQTWIKQWEMVGQKKVALKVESTTALQACAIQGARSVLDTCHVCPGVSSWHVRISMECSYTTPNW